MKEEAQESDGDDVFAALSSPAVNPIDVSTS